MLRHRPGIFRRRRAAADEPARLSLSARSHTLRAVGLFFRKRKSIARGLALNFSKRGVSLSGGMKGLRLSSRGNVSAGRKGIFFRKKLW